MSRAYNCQIRFECDGPISDELLEKIKKIVEDYTELTDDDRWISEDRTVVDYSGSTMLYSGRGCGDIHYDIKQAIGDRCVVESNWLYLDEWDEMFQD